MRLPLYIFAGGGTGGHLYPGLAVAEELLRLRPGAKVVFACSNRAIDRRILDRRPYAVIPQPVRPLPRRAGEALLFLRAWRRSGRLARDLLRDLRPAAVLGLGGFAAGPVLKHAERAGVRAALLNPDAVPGKANRYLAGRVEAIFTQFDSTAEHFGSRGRGKVRAVGCPVRSELTAAGRDEAIRHFGLDADKHTLLVLGGSLGAEPINKAVAALAADFSPLADAWQILHIVGPGAGRAVVGGAGLPGDRLEYCEHMDLAYAAADLALCRGGAVTIAELAVTATPAVILPYPHHADRQQHLNAAALAEAGAALVCEDAIDAARNAETLRSALLPLLSAPGRLADMRKAVGELARGSAAAEVAGWLVG